MKRCTVEGNVVKLPEGQLDRKTYLDVKKSLELIGGKWKGGKVSGFVFVTDPSALLNQVAGGEKKNLKKEFQFFATPSDLAERMVKLSSIDDSVKTILEPSAGQGAIIRAINAVTDIAPDCYELMDTNVHVLGESGLTYHLIGSDFLSHPKDGKKYDRIIANPPFTKNQDIDHLMAMYSCLADKGRLVCITSESWVLGSQKKQTEFRAWLNSVNAETSPLKRGTFKESGTMVGGMLVIIDKI